MITLRTGTNVQAQPVVKAINYLFEKDHRSAFTRFLTDGRNCLTNNAAERSLRGKAWLFAGSDRGGNRTAFMYSMIVTAKMNDIDPQVWLADVLARMAALTVSKLPETPAMELAKRILKAKSSLKTACAGWLRFICKQ